MQREEMMTYKEIRQLAEEFIKAVPESWPYDSDPLTTIEIVEDMIEWLAEHNYLVLKRESESGEPEVSRLNHMKRIKQQQDSHKATVDYSLSKAFDWDSFPADLAKDITLKIVGSQLHGNKPQEIGKIAVEVAKSVVEELKKK